jgi:hypothetical protein
LNETPKPAPNGAKAAGKRLWSAVLTDYELAEHELVLLTQAVHVADTCDELQRTQPAGAELRAQRLLLARLVVALRVPIGDQEMPSKTGAPRLQRRGIRGLYAIGGGKS